ncbi:hypothetical protein PSSA1_v1c1950 [Candidatus Phytoplasma solani]|uniref:Uncharacterized protein n=1 Tax=Candidatus Phytoplasma solani TaxID=69896 RepID=A0A421NY79_9MOLU|nr:hypothetical protein PSSA1_v1c1950 [Candidatus Phytoplasma solani]
MGIEPTSLAWKAKVMAIIRRPLQWSGRQDLNPRPPGPKPGAMPS